MDFERLRYYKDLLIENYDYAQTTEGMVWFQGVLLKDIAEVPFHFADSVLFEHTDDSLDVFIYQESMGNPIIIKNLI